MLVPLALYDDKICHTYFEDINDTCTTLVSEPFLDRRQAAKVLNENDVPGRR